MCQERKDSRKEQPSETQAELREVLRYRRSDAALRSALVNLGFQTELRAERSELFIQQGLQWAWH